MSIAFFNANLAFFNASFYVLLRRVFECEGFLWDFVDYLSCTFEDASWTLRRIQRLLVGGSAVSQHGQVTEFQARTLIRNAEVLWL